MQKNSTKTPVLCAIFGSFMFLQYVILRFCNQAGRGYLPDAQQESVYYAVQAFVILGFLVYALTRRLQGRSACLLRCVLALLLIASAGLAFTPTDTVLAIVLAFLSALLLGYTGGAVYLRMAAEAAAGNRIGVAMGVGCSAAVVLQYVLQLRWNLPWLLYAGMLAAFALLLWLLDVQPPLSAADRRLPTRRLVFSLLIASALILFCSFYNGYIHHLQVLSGYTDYNVYTWPRLLWIPAYLLFGFLGDFRRGRLVPIAALCVSAFALLNSVLAGASGSGWLNMCLFYNGIASSVAYYDLIFWRLAPQTKHPALWASVGRILDSLLVLIGGLLHVSELSAAIVLGMNIAVLVGAIVLMAVNGDFNLAEKKPAPQSDPFPLLQKRYALTPAEVKVLRELVLTEDKQSAIADRLSVKVRTVQASVTSLYRKTGVSTRAGLVQLYRDAE